MKKWDRGVDENDTTASPFEMFVALGEGKRILVVVVVPKSLSSSKFAS